MHSFLLETFEHQNVYKVNGSPKIASIYKFVEKHVKRVEAITSNKQTQIVN